jgi:hypothetical protein
MEQSFLIDTNILIYYLDGHIPLEHEAKIDHIFTHSFNVSVVSKIELLGWRKYTPEQYQIASQFIWRARIIYLDDEIAEQTVSVKQTYPLKLPDAIIAATALFYDWVLVTRNTKDFESITRLKIYNPFI